MTCTIKKLSDRGFAFVSVGGPGREGDHFPHATHLQDVAFTELKIGDKVEFDSHLDARGLECRNVPLSGRKPK